LEAHDASAAHGEVVGDARVEVYPGGLVAGGVAGEDDPSARASDFSRGIVIAGADGTRSKCRAHAYSGLPVR
jgi:hypothetical protein